MYYPHPARQPPPRQQVCHFENSPPLLPSHGLSGEYMDPSFNLWNADRIPHNRYAMLSAFSATGGLPTLDPALEKDSHSDNCGSCCDKDDCSDICENEDCNDDDRCPDCTVVCPDPQCEPATKCVDPVCATTPRCETVVEYCHDDSCQQKCDAQCELSHSKLGCRVELDCPEYQWCAGSDYASSISTEQTCFSFHINNANANRWPHFDEHHGHIRYPNVAPNVLSVGAQQALDHFTNPNQGDHDPGGMRPPEDTSPPPHKRRKTSETTPEESEERMYSTAPSSISATPLPEMTGDLTCRWDDGCDQTFYDSVELQHHIQNSHGGSLIDGVCLWDSCGADMANPQSLLNHVKVTHVSTHQHACQWGTCHQAFQTEVELRAHLDGHLRDTHKNCQWPVGLHDHKHHHVDPHLHSRSPQLPTAPPSPPTESEEIRMCEWQDTDLDGNLHTCGQEFSSANDLQQHAKDVHITALKKRTGYHCRWASCNRKDKPFSQKGKVERHLQTHTGFKSCTCNFCGKEFSAPQALQQHIRTHTGEKPYKCDICGKEFAQGSAMTMHKRVHTGERPLVCDFPGCGKRFSESSNLSKHRKTHNPVGQHRCGFPGCERSFHRLDQMKRHQKTHGVVYEATERVV